MGAEARPTRPVVAAVGVPAVLVLRQQRPTVLTVETAVSPTPAQPVALVALPAHLPVRQVRTVGVGAGAKAQRLMLVVLAALVLSTR